MKTVNRTFVLVAEARRPIARRRILRAFRPMYGEKAEQVLEQMFRHMTRRDKRKPRAEPDPLYPVQ